MRATDGMRPARRSRHGTLGERTPCPLSSLSRRFPKSSRRALTTLLVVPTMLGGGHERVEYRLIAGDPGHRVGDDGSCWSRLTRGARSVVGTRWRRLRSSPDGRGYPSVSIRGQKKKVHRLVLECFVGLRPPGLECRHLNGIKTDNRLRNLAWGTREENAQDRIVHGGYGTRANGQPKGESHWQSKLTEVKVHEVRRLRQQGLSLNTSRQMRKWCHPAH
jgi:hypothetical protein